MYAIAIFIGLILGGAAGELIGPAAGALLAWLLVRSMRQADQLAALRKSLAWLEAQIAAPQPQEGDTRQELSSWPASTDVAEVAGAISATAPPEEAAAPQAPPAAEAAEPWLEPAVETATLRDSVADGEPTTSWPQVVQPAMSVSAPPAALAAARNWLMGGNTIVKAGVAILFIGLAFLAKFASEHVHVPVEVRLAGIAAVAAVLLGLGWRLRTTRPGYAQVLQGGAVAVLYLTLFVGFRFYGVLPAGLVFVMMVLVAALAAALAVLQDAPALAVIGALGGFATPLLISTGSGDQVALFGYYLVLDLGIAAVAWHRTWRALNLIGFLGTFIVGTAWGATYYEPGRYPSSQAFLIAYFLLFNAVLLLPARRLQDEDGGEPGRTDRWVQGFLLFGLPTITFVLQYGLLRHTEYGVALSALVLAAFYTLMAAAMRSHPRLAVIFDASLAIAVVFLSLVIPFALDARSTAGAWALEGAGLVWLGFRQKRWLSRAFGYALLLLLAGVAMLWGFDRYGEPTAVFNAYLFNAVMAAAACVAAAFFVKRDARKAGASPGPIAAFEAIAEPLLLTCATLWAVVEVGVQVDAFVDVEFRLAAWLVCLSGIALAFTLLAARLDWQYAAYPAMAHAPVLAVAVFQLAAILANPASGGGWWAWPIALATHLAVLWRAARHWPALAQQAMHVLGVLVLAGLGTLQGRAITEAWGDSRSAWAWLGWLAVPALLLMVLPRPAAARRWPVSAAPAAYQGVAAGVLSAGLLLWTLLANGLSDGSAQPLPYVPLLNPLDLGIGVALLAAWWWLHSDAARSTWTLHPQLPAAVLGLTGFAWLNAMLVRAFHHFGDVPFQIDAWVDSLAVQTGTTLLWTTTALVLMWLAARRAVRLPWMVGAALLAAVVMKLLLVDLSGSGTVTRIVSFIGVGVLMLVIGYVAPMPTLGSAKNADHASG
ncbi:MAG: DUF2339 domain-containing protein [Burkholderiales bacterium]|nr:DUF2339 domain-containing protein [Burkholderiales bacterium]